MKTLYIFADKEILKVKKLYGLYIIVFDERGWEEQIPLTRVERFCDEDGNHIELEINNN